MHTQAHTLKYKIMRASRQQTHVDERPQSLKTWANETWVTLLIRKKICVTCLWSSVQWAQLWQLYRWWEKAVYKNYNYFYIRVFVCACVCVEYRHISITCFSQSAHSACCLFFIISKSDIAVKPGHLLHGTRSTLCADIVVCLLVSWRQFADGDNHPLAVLRHVFLSPTSASDADGWLI